MSMPTASLNERHETSGHVNIRAISDLLSEFDGVEWNLPKLGTRELRLLRATYHLLDNDVKIVIIRRFKGRALKWKPEHLEIEVDELLKQMRLTFDYRPNRVTAKKLFENRQWQANESFASYYHEKLVLANRVPIDKSELVDYLIDGIPEVYGISPACTISSRRPIY